MAKKQKRSDFTTPEKTKAPTKSQAKARAAAVADAADAAGGESAGTAQVSSSKKASVAKSSGSAKKTPPQKKGMSSNMQWALVIGVIGAIVGGVLLISVLNAGGGSGVLSATNWDIPVRADDTDNGDDDGRIKLADFAGTPTMVNFFASWCTSCDREMPYMTSIGEQFADQFDLVFINGNEDSGSWRDMADRHDIVGTFPVARDIKGTNRNGLLRELGGNTGMPATAFYDASGRLIKFTNGEIDESTLRAELRALGVEL